MTLHTAGLSNVKSSISKLLCSLQHPAALRLITSPQCNLLPALRSFQVSHNGYRKQALLPVSDRDHNGAVKWIGLVCFCGQALHMWLFLTSQGCCWQLSPCSSRDTKNYSVQIWRKAHFQCRGHTAHTELKSQEINQVVVLHSLTPVFKQTFIQF